MKRLNPRHDTQIMLYSINVQSLDFPISDKSLKSTKIWLMKVKVVFNFNMFCVQIAILFGFFQGKHLSASPQIMLIFFIFASESFSYAVFCPPNKIYFCKYHVMKNKRYSMQMMSLTCRRIITKFFLFFCFENAKSKLNIC